LTSFSAYEKLRELKTTNPEFWKELMSNSSTIEHSSDNLEDNIDLQDSSFNDDNDLPLAAVIASVTAFEDTGNHVLQPKAEMMDFKAECADLDVVEKGNVEDDEMQNEVALGHGRRKHKPNSLYMHTFWQHHNDEEA
jgi:hypothetical protein